MNNEDFKKGFMIVNGSKIEPLPEDLFDIPSKEREEEIIKYMSNKIVEDWVAKYGNNPEVDKILDERVEYMENKQQTAVEWLIGQLRQLAYSSNTHLGMGDVRVTQGMLDDLEEQAKQMEKQESIIELRYKDGTPMRKYNPSKLQKMVDLLKEDDASSKKEISDEEIRYAAYKDKSVNIGMEPESAFIDGAKWYREQVKKK